MITARLVVDKVTKQTGQETVELRAVYSDDKNSANYSFSKYTPVANFSMLVTNEAIFGAFEPGDVFELGFTRIYE